MVAAAERLRLVKAVTVVTGRRKGPLEGSLVSSEKGFGVPGVPE